LPSRLAGADDDHLAERRQPTASGVLQEHTDGSFDGPVMRGLRR
jgi:hypothetical protein